MTTATLDRRLGEPKTDVERVMAHYGIGGEEAKEWLKIHPPEILLPVRGTGLGPGRITESQVKAIAVKAADEVMERIGEREHDSLVLHSIPSAFGSPGIVVNEALAKATPCRYIEYKPGKRLAFSKGIIGALSDTQEEIYCPEWVKLDSPGLERRLANWMESVETCKAEIAEIPKGERLEPWLSCMSRELAAHGVEA